MNIIIEEIKEFVQNKVYIVILSLVAVCSYGYAIVNPIIGMDDTAISLYFEEGMAPYVGRWTLYLLNKIIKLDEFAPWTIELVSVLVIMLSVTLWCIIFRRIVRNAIEVPTWCYVFVACLFISCPLISEVFVFYLHNGICIGYGLVALAILWLMDCLKMESNFRTRYRDKISKLFCSAFFLSMALGCYESFAVVFLIGAVMMFFLLRRLNGREGKESVYQTRVTSWLTYGICVCVLSLIIRTVILKIIYIVYDLEKFDAYNVMYRSLFGNLLQNRAELNMELKRFWLKYYVNAIVYQPITILVVSLVIIGVYAIYYSIRKKDVWLSICFGGIIILPIVMCIIEGIATRYRTAQYVPLVIAFAAMLIIVEIWCYKSNRKERMAAGGCFWGRCNKMLSVVFYLAASIVIFNQCTEMNKWFYVDDLKYQHFNQVMNQVAYDLERQFDTSKPIVLCGAYEVPYEIAQYAYCSFSSKEYAWIWLLSDLVDPHLKEKYYASDGGGYIFTETPVTSTLQWGLTAFDGTAGQLFKFWEMHGYSFIYEKDLNKIEKAKDICDKSDQPGYPDEGYIVEYEEYIVVNLSNKY